MPVEKSIDEQIADREKELEDLRKLKCLAELNKEIAAEKRDLVELQAQVSETEPPIEKPAKASSNKTVKEPIGKARSSVSQKQPAKASSKKRKAKKSLSSFMDGGIITDVKRLGDKKVVLYVPSPEGATGLRGEIRSDENYELYKFLLSKSIGVQSSLLRSYNNKEQKLYIVIDKNQYDKLRVEDGKLLKSTDLQDCSKELEGCKTYKKWKASRPLSDMKEQGIVKDIVRLDEENVMVFVPVAEGVTSPHGDTKRSSETQKTSNGKTLNGFIKNRQLNGCEVLPFNVDGESVIGLKLDKKNYLEYKGEAFPDDISELNPLTEKYKALDKKKGGHEGQTLAGLKKQGIIIDVKKVKHDGVDKVAIYVSVTKGVTNPDKDKKKEDGSQKTSNGRTVVHFVAEKYRKLADRKCFLLSADNKEGIIGFLLTKDAYSEYKGEGDTLPQFEGLEELQEQIIMVDKRNKGSKHKDFVVSDSEEEISEPIVRKKRGKIERYVKSDLEQSTSESETEMPVLTDSEGDVSDNAKAKPINDGDWVRRSSRKRKNTKVSYADFSDDDIENFEEYDRGADDEVALVAASAAKEVLPAVAPAAKAESNAKESAHKKKADSGKVSGKGKKLQVAAAADSKELSDQKAGDKRKPKRKFRRVIESDSDEELASESNLNMSLGAKDGSTILQVASAVVASGVALGGGGAATKMVPLADKSAATPKKQKVDKVPPNRRTDRKRKVQEHQGEAISIGGVAGKGKKARVASVGAESDFSSVTLASLKSDGIIAGVRSFGDRVFVCMEAVGNKNYVHCDTKEISDKEKTCGLYFVEFCANKQIDIKLASNKVLFDNDMFYVEISKDKYREHCGEIEPLQKVPRTVEDKLRQRIKRASRYKTREDKSSNNKTPGLGGAVSAAEARDYVDMDSTPVALAKVVAKGGMRGKKKAVAEKELVLDYNKETFASLKRRGIINDIKQCGDFVKIGLKTSGGVRLSYVRSYLDETRTFPNTKLTCGQHLREFCKIKKVSINRQSLDVKNNRFYVHVDKEQYLIHGGLFGIEEVVEHPVDFGKGSDRQGESASFAGVSGDSGLASANFGMESNRAADDVSGVDKADVDLLLNLYGGASEASVGSAVAGQYGIAPAFVGQHANAPYGSAPLNFLQPIRGLDGPYVDASVGSVGSAVAGSAATGVSHFVPRGPVQPTAQLSSAELDALMKKYPPPVTKGTPVSADQIARPESTVRANSTYNHETGISNQGLGDLNLLPG